MASQDDSARSPAPPLQELTITELRKKLRESPEDFERAIDQLLATCSDPETIRFWTAMKQFARRPSTR